MKSFKTYLLENNLSVLLEYKEWHQLVTQFGDKIIDQFKLGYKPPSTSEKDIVPHKTEFIKTKLGLHNIPKHHGRWILNQVIKGKISNHEDIASTIIPNLSKFEELKDTHKLNLSKVNDRSELFNIVQKHAPEESDSLNLKQGQDYTLHGENEHWKVIQPHNREAACGFGSNTDWCTAAKENNRFEQYSEEGPLHILIPKNPLYKREKYQYHSATGQYMDHNDTPVNKDKNKKQLSIIDRPLPDIDKNLKFNLEFHTAISNKNTPETDLLKYTKHPNFGSDSSHISSAFKSPHEIVAKAAIEHPNFGSDSSHISSALKSPHEFVAKAAIEHRNFGSGSSHISSALKSPHEFVAKAAIEHRNFGSDRSHMGDALDSPHESVAKAAMEHPNFGSDEIHIPSALHSPHESVAKAAMEHPNFGSDEIHIPSAFQSRHEFVAKAAMEHPNFSRSRYYIEDALKSPHKSVVIAAKAHPNFSRRPGRILNALRSFGKEVSRVASSNPIFRVLRSKRK